VEKKETKHNQIGLNIKTGGTEFEHNFEGCIKLKSSVSFVVALCG
jgi:hypothetical protein